LRKGLNTASRTGFIMAKRPTPCGRIVREIPRISGELERGGEINPRLSRRTGHGAEEGKTPQLFNTITVPQRAQENKGSPSRKKKREWGERNKTTMLRGFNNLTIKKHIATHQSGVGVDSTKSAIN